MRNYPLVMGKSKKKKHTKALTQAVKMGDFSALKELIPQDTKSKCCNKYAKNESKRCKRCPCYDLLLEVA
ncbi:MAG: hypothetical protein V3U92_15840 [Cellulophaga sp.]